MKRKESNWIPVYDLCSQSAGHRLEIEEWGIENASVQIRCKYSKCIYMKMHVSIRLVAQI